LPRKAHDNVLTVTDTGIASQQSISLTCSSDFTEWCRA